MGLIRAMASGIGSTLGDEFKEYVTCPEIEKNVIIQRGQVNHGKGNKNPSEGVITNGSKIVVPLGMAMMLIQNGEIKELSAVPGEYIWDQGTESSVFSDGLCNGVKETFKNIGKRFSYGGQVPQDQRVYYVNLLAITGNKFGSPQPKKITDDKYGMLEVTFFGEYAFQVKDPIVLVQNIIGANAKDTVTYDEVVGGQLKSKFVEQFTQAVTIVMRKHHIPFGDIGMYNKDISDEMNTILDDTWHQQYGLEITDVAISDINLTDESMKRVSRIDDATIFGNGNIQSGLMAQATATAMENASSNANGAMMGFMGMNMAQATGGNVMGAVQPNTVEPTAAKEQPEPGTLFASPEKKEDAPAESEEAQATAKFCPNCGTPTNGANFCPNCGNKLN